MAERIWAVFESNGRCVGWQANTTSRTRTKDDRYGCEDYRIGCFGKGYSVAGRNTAWIQQQELNQWVGAWNTKFGCRTCGSAQNCAGMETCVHVSECDTCHFERVTSNNGQSSSKTEVDIDLAVSAPTYKPTVLAQAKRTLSTPGLARTTKKHALKREYSKRKKGPPQKAIDREQ